MKKLGIFLFLFFSCTDTETLLIEKNIEQEAILKNPFTEISAESVQVADSLSAPEDYLFRSHLVSITKPEGNLDKIQSFQMSVKTGIRGEFSSQFGLSDKIITTYLSFLHINGHSFVRMDRDGSFYPDKRDRFLISNGKKLISYFADTMEIESASSDFNFDLPETDNSGFVPFYTGLVEKSIIADIKESFSVDKWKLENSIMTVDLTDYYDENLIPSLFPDMDYRITSYFVKYDVEKCPYLGTQLFLEDADRRIMTIEEIPVYEDETGFYIRIGKVTEISYDFEKRMI